MKKYIIVLFVLASIFCNNIGFAQTTPKHHKTTRRSTPCNTMTATSEHRYKHYGIAKHHAVKKHPIQRFEETIVLDDHSATAIVNIKDGEVYVNDSLVTRVKNPKNEDHRIIINYIAPPPPAPVAENIEHIKVNAYTGQKPEAMLGVYGGDNNCTAGVFIDDVLPFSPADKAGLYPGDVISKIDDRTINNAEDLKNAIGVHNVGDVVSVTYNGYNGTETKQVELIQKEDITSCGCDEPPLSCCRW